MAKDQAPAYRQSEGATARTQVLQDVRSRREEDCEGSAVSTECVAWACHRRKTSVSGGIGKQTRDPIHACRGVGRGDMGEAALRCGAVPDVASTTEIGGHALLLVHSARSNCSKHHASTAIGVEVAAACHLRLGTSKPKLLPDGCASCGRQSSRALRLSRWCRRRSERREGRKTSP